MLILKLAAPLVVLGLVWVFVGRRVSTLLDSIWTVPAGSLPVSPISIDGSLIRFGDFAIDMRLAEDSRNRVIYVKDQQDFQLGTQTASHDLQPDAGDEMSLNLRRSWLAWPNFQINFMTGHSPSWQRNTYYTLTWKKLSGAKLELVWRYEQYYYPSDGWAGSTMTREGSTGLIRSTLTPARSHE